MGEARALSILVVLVAIILVSSIVPYLSTVSVSGPSHYSNYVYEWFVALRIDGGFVNTSLVEELISSVNLSMFTYVFEEGGRDYLIYRTPYSPHLVVEAYNDGDSAIISLHYMPRAESVLWSAHPCGEAIACDFAFTNKSSLMDAASSAGWSVVELENRTYYKCTTVTPGGEPPTCVQINEMRAIMLKNITDGFVEARIFSSYSQGSMPWADIVFLTNNPGPEADEAAKELTQYLLGIDYSPSWYPPSQSGFNINTARYVLAVEAEYLASLGVLDTGGRSNDEVSNTIHMIDSVNQTVKLSQSGEVTINPYIPPNPQTIANEIYTWPCTPYLGLLHPYCMITTTLPPPQTTATTTSSSTTETHLHTTNTGATGTGTQSLTTMSNGSGTQELATSNGDENKDLTYLGLSVILALIAAAITGALVRR